MTKLCRICYTSSSSQKFFKFFDQRHDFAQNLFYISSITVFEVSKTQPALICQQCASDLSTAARIKKKALETDKFFMDFTNSDDIQLLNEIINSNELQPLISVKIEPDEIKPEPDKTIEELLDFLDYDQPNLETFEDFKEPKKKKIKKVKQKSQPKVTIHQCEHCGRIFKWLKDLRSHLTIHSDARNVSCEVCGRLFKTEDVMRHHKMLHLKIRFCCDLCGKNYSTKKVLSKHIRKEHLKTLNSTSVCHLCGKALSRPSQLKIHMLYSHEGEKNFKCEICDKAFFTKYKLKQHDEAVHGERPWICEICSRNFSKRYKLGEHMKQIHKIIMAKPHPFICTLCGVAFEKKNLLNEHLKMNHKS